MTGRSPFQGHVASTSSWGSILGHQLGQQLQTGIQVFDVHPRTNFENKRLF
jgi:hypothetical protein